MDNIKRALALNDRIAAVAPIQGVSIGKPDDPSSWRVDFDPSATPAQRQAAAAVIASWKDDDWSGSPEARVSAALEKIIAAHVRALALEREKAQNPDAGARVQAELDKVSTQIEALRSSQWLRP